MGQKLTDNNPNVADLSDTNRPTRLAERYTELYDNQWTDAFEAIHGDEEEKTVLELKSFLVVRGVVYFNSILSFSSSVNGISSHVHVFCV